MAITLEQEPSNYYPCFNGLYFVATSDNTGEERFRFIFDLYVDGTLAGRYLVPPRPDFNNAIWNASKALQDNISYNIDQSTTEFANNDNSFVKYRVKIGEQYISGGVLTDFTDLTLSTEQYTINAALNSTEILSYSASDYLLNNSTSLFLTNKPRTERIELNQLSWLYTIDSDGATFDSIEIERFNSAGASLGTTTILNPNTGGTDDERFNRVGVGTKNLIDSQGASYLDNTSSYTVTAKDSLSASISETMTFNIEGECRYGTRRIHFLNKLGGFDAFNFNMKYNEIVNINRRTARKPIGTAALDSFTFSESDIEQQDYYIDYTRTFTIKSDWLTEAQSAWLEELLTSPVIFEEIDGVLYSIKLTSNSYEVQRTLNRKVFNLKINYSRSVKSYRQVI